VILAGIGEVDGAGVRGFQGDCGAGGEGVGAGGGL
jgi:hypothetical protein